MAKKRTMDELRQVKDSVYRKPPPKKMPRKSGKVKMKEIDGKDTPTSTIHHNLSKKEEFIPNPDLDRPARRPSKINRYKRKRLEREAKVIETAMLRGIFIGTIIGSIFGIIVGMIINQWL